MGISFLPAPSAGKIGQVLNISPNASFSTNSTSYTDITGATLNITPSSVNSKILFICSFKIAVDATSGWNGIPSSYVNVVRGSTQLSETNIVIFRSGDTAMYLLSTPGAITYTDSPNTTSQITYKMQARKDGSNNLISVSQINMSIQEILP